MYFGGLKRAVTSRWLSKASEVFQVMPEETSEVQVKAIGCARRALLVRGLTLRAPARRIVTAGGSPQLRSAFKHELVAYIK